MSEAEFVPSSLQDLDGTLSASQLPASGVTPGTYTDATITVDTTGRVTAASSGSGGSGMAIGGTIGNSPSTGDILVVGAGGVLAQVATIAESQVTNLVTDLAAKAPLASPALSGTPTAPTAGNGTNTTQLATTAFVLANAGSMAIGGAITGGTAGLIAHIGPGPVLAQDAAHVWDATNHREGIGAAAPRAKLDACGSVNLAHFAKTDSDIGGYFDCDGSAAIYVSGGAQYSTFTSDYVFTAKSSGACGFIMEGGNVTFWASASLTAGNTFTPAYKWQMNTAGDWSGFALSSTAANRKAGRMAALFASNTDATRKGRMVLYAADFTGTDRECIRIESDGTQGLYSVFGAVAAAQQTGGAATAGATYTATEQGMLQKVYNALRTFGYLS